MHLYEDYRLPAHFIIKKVTFISGSVRIPVIPLAHCLSQIHRDTHTHTLTLQPTGLLSVTLGGG